MYVHCPTHVAQLTMILNQMEQMGQVRRLISAESPFALPCKHSSERRLPGRPKRVLVTRYLLLS